MQEKIWVNESVVLQWMDSVDVLKEWYTRLQILLGYVARWKQVKLRLCVLPGSCTLLLQPLDVSLNKPFKANV